MKDMTDLLTRGKEVVVRGIVVNINLEPLAWCGDAQISISTPNHRELILLTNGGRRPPCSPLDVRAGDAIEACGIVVGENKIALTNPEQHYLRREPC